MADDIFYKNYAAVGTAAEFIYEGKAVRQFSAYALLRITGIPIMQIFRKETSYTMTHWFLQFNFKKGVNT